jgi:hypothetical protein
MCFGGLTVNLKGDATRPPGSPGGAPGHAWVPHGRPRSAPEAAVGSAEGRASIRSIIATFDQDMLARNQQALVAVYAEDGILMPPNAPMIRGARGHSPVLRGIPRGDRLRPDPHRHRG